MDPHANAEDDTLGRIVNDKKTTIEDLKNLMAAFVKEREWNQFHTPKNLTMALSAEASELM